MEDRNPCPCALLIIQLFSPVKNCVYIVDKIVKTSYNLFEIMNY